MPLSAELISVGLAVVGARTLTTIQIAQGSVVTAGTTVTYLSWGY
jgi:hypothetical protein